MNVADFGAEPWHGAPNDLAGYAWRAPSPRAAILLQHGYAEYAGRYAAHHHQLVRRLTEGRISVFAFDMAGHGLSRGARGVTDIGRTVDAHLAARRTLAKESVPLFLIGHSLGGLVTAASVAHCGDDLAGVLLSAPALPDGNLGLRLLARLIAKISPRAGVSPLGDPEGISTLDAEVTAYRTDPLVFQRRLPAKLAATALDTARAMWSRLPDWQAPTLVIHGAADTYTDPAGSRRLIGEIAATDRRLCLFPGGRHELLNDTPRDEALATLLAWIEARIKR